MKRLLAIRGILFLSLFLWGNSFLFSGTLSMPREIHRILSQTGTELTLRLVYDFGSEKGRFRLKEFVGNHFLFTGDSLVGFPVSSFPFVGSARRPHVFIVRSHQHNFPLTANLEIPVETAIWDSGGTPSSSAVKPFTSPPDVPLVSVKKLGCFREFPLWSLRVFPIQFSQDRKTVTLFDTLIIRVDWGSSGLQKRYRPIPENASLLQQVKETVLNPDAVKNMAVASSPLRLGKFAPISPSDRKVTGFKLLVDREGWYKITYAFLKEQKIPLEEVHWANLSVKLKGKAIPFVSHGLEDGHFDQGDSFEFWGHPNFNTLYPDADDMYFDPYALESAYFVTWSGSSGKRYGSENGGFFSAETTTVLKPRNFMATVHAEKDQMYSRLSRVTPGVNRDHWFWGSIGAGEIQNYPVDLPTPDIYSNRLVKLKLMLHGMTYGHHKVRAFLSNHRILQGDWYDQTKYSLETTPAEGVFGGQLDEEKNGLTIINDSDDELDFFLVNWFDVTYPRLYKAEKNFIKFTRPDDWPNGRYQFAIDGFSRPNVEVFKINQSQIFGGQVEEIVDSLRQKSYRLTFEDDVPSAKTTYIALTPEAKLEPESAQVVYESNLKNPANQADYLIITHPYFVENEDLRRLIDLRESQGLSVKMATTDEIYNQFSDGEKSPVGIKNFLTYVYRNWQKPVPTYVLLVGDGNYAVRSRTAQEVNFVPVYHYQTIKFGASVSDTWYTLVSGNDLIPDYFIGRLPARTNEELNHMVEKILSYETHPANGDWRNRLLMIAGHDKFFHQQNAELARDVLPKDFLVQKLTANPPTDPFYGDTQKLVSYFDQGVSYANFMGHGGGAVWADNLLFRFDDIQLLKNSPNYPIVTSMTCFTAAFDSPSDVSCLGEQLLKLDHRGVVAFLGASGVGWVWNDYYFLLQLVHHLFVKPAPTIGAAVRLGKIDYQSKYFTPQRESMVNQYNLLGDPALRPAFPKDSLQIQTSLAVHSAGDSLIARISAPVSTGLLTAAIVDSIGKIRQSFELPYTGGKQISLKIPPDLENGVYHIPLDLSAETESANYHGSLVFSLGKSALFDVTHTPENVIVGDSVLVSAKLVGISKQASVACVFETPQPDSIALKWQPVESLFRATRPFLAKTVGEVNYHISWNDNGRNFHSTEHSFQVNDLTDLRVVQRSISFGAQDSLILQAVVQNAGAVSLSRVSVAFFEMNGGEDSLKIGETQVDFNPFETKTVEIPVTLPPGEINIHVIVDPRNQVREKIESNNWAESIVVPSAFQFQPGKGFVLGRGKTDSTCTWHKISVTILPESQAHPFILSFETDAWNAYKTNQLVAIANPQGWDLPVLILNTPSDPKVSAKIRFALGDSIQSISNRDVNLFRLYPSTKTWAKVLQTNLNDSILVATTSQLGAFAFLKSTDRTPPEVAIAANKGGFFDGGYVGNHPEFTIDFRDENGIYPDLAAQKILLDGQILNGEKTDIQTNFGPNNLLLTFSPELSSGTHQLTVHGMDCVGNLSKAASVHFKVAANFDLKILGNYPNPFKDQTVFAYELTAQAENLSLKIYTVSGRLIRRFDLLDFVDDPDPLEPGYHEQTWDSTDGNGDQVANGVYYFKFSAKGEKKTIEKTGKIVRIK